MEKCLICHEKFKEAPENAPPRDKHLSFVEEVSDTPVQLTCGHVYGLECLREWVYQWDQESKLSLCPLCDTHFGM